MLATLSNAKIMLKVGTPTHTSHTLTHTHIYTNTHTCTHTYKHKHTNQQRNFCLNQVYSSLFLKAYHSLLHGIQALDTDILNMSRSYSILNFCKHSILNTI